MLIAGEGEYTNSIKPSLRFALASHRDNNRTTEAFFSESIRRIGYYTCSIRAAEIQLAALSMHAASCTYFSSSDGAGSITEAS